MTLLIEKYKYTPLSRASENGKRLYTCPDGSRVSSVTTILDATKSAESKKALFEWRKRVGEVKAQEISTEASSRGTRMHSFLENYIKTGKLDDPGTNPFSQQSHKMANNIIENSFHNISEVWGTEASLYYPELYAGTTDAVGVWKGEPAIIDFKQSNKLKKKEYISDYFTQLAAYSIMHNKMHNTDIRTGVILMCTQDYVYQEFVIEGSEFDYWSNIWWDRVEEFYSKNR